MLNQFTADALQRPVITGPPRAPSSENLLVQAMGLGAIQDMGQLRQIVARSFPTVTYQPQDKAAGWDAAYERLLKLL